MTWGPEDRHRGQGDMTLGGEDTSRSLRKAFLHVGHVGQKGTLLLLYSMHRNTRASSLGPGRCCRMEHGHWYRRRFSAFVTKQPETLPSFTSVRSSPRSVRGRVLSRMRLLPRRRGAICLLVSVRVPHTLGVLPRQTCPFHLSVPPAGRGERKKTKPQLWRALSCPADK